MPHWFHARLGKDLSGEARICLTLVCREAVSGMCKALQTHALPFSSCSIQKHALAGTLDTHPCFVCAVYSFVGRLNDREILVTLCCWWSSECLRFINQAIV